jgi:hypothetical protein
MYFSDKILLYTFTELSGAYIISFAHTGGLPASTVSPNLRILAVFSLFLGGEWLADSFI